MIKFILIFNTSGKPRIVRFYESLPDTERLSIQSDVSSLCLSSSKQEGILNYKDYTLVFRRYGNLVFSVGITDDENELSIMELIQNLVEVLMKCLGKMSEADVIMNIDKVYMILDEMITEGYIAETNQARIIAPLQLLETVRK